LLFYLRFVVNKAQNSSKSPPAKAFSDFGDKNLKLRASKAFNAFTDYLTTGLLKIIRSAYDSCLGVFPRLEKKQNYCCITLRSFMVHLT
jgi:hypothetical protein